MKRLAIDGGCNYKLACVFVCRSTVLSVDGLVFTGVERETEGLITVTSGCNDY